MPIEIPGYYFDAARNKYFKIEKSQTAPPAARWTSDSVKRRKLEREEEEEEAWRAGGWRGKHSARAGIRRHEALRLDGLAGGMLARECCARGAMGMGMGMGGDGPEALRAAAWVGGMVDQGAVSFVPRAAGGRGRRLGNMPCFYVAGEGCHTEVGVAYGTIDEEILLGTHLEPDANGRIGGREQETRTMGRLGSTWAPLSEMVRCPQMSSVAYHEPSHQMLLTSRDPEQNCGLFMFSPPISTTIDDRRHWLIGQAVRYQRIAIRPRSQPQNIIHRCTPAPSSSPLLCIVGTNSGILSVNPNGATTSLSSFQGKHRPGARRHSDGIGEIFDQVFSAANHNVVLAGGRRSRFWVTDLRAPSADWTHVNTDSSVTHIRSINEHQVIVAGLRNSMCLYDLRFVTSSPSSSFFPSSFSSSSSRSPNRYKPLLCFAEHKNAAHVHTGLDVSAEMGLVAAAQDDGTVKLFSLRFGSALRSRRDALGAIQAETPIKALQFQRLPGERGPSLFVAEGAELRKMSFGRGPFDE
ncbi:hypothetical protein ESCO_001766 [Escovopsis weberi]|uniref:Myocyte-specific enhancer factor 2d n=1 Tax=Escovopsis weberi TaxID=150374 RepID=A0A0N0RU58_ESCWE|nr:hypothetical protein ESCO_001766 [Escovopsis weberi]